jgi:hypothetical protein
MGGRCCKLSNEFSTFTNCITFLDCLKDYQLLEDCVSWFWLVSRWVHDVSETLCLADSSN